MRVRLLAASPRSLPASTCGLVVEHAGDHRRNLPGEHVIEARPDALVGNVSDVDARHGLQQLHGEMRVGAGAGRRVGQIAGLALGERDELGERARLDRGMHRQHARQRHDDRDRREIAHRVEQHLLVGQMIDRQRAGGHQQRVAVGRRVRGRLDADHVAGAGTVLDDRTAAPSIAKGTARSTRAEMSVPPPGADGTMILTGFDG